MKKQYKLIFLFLIISCKTYVDKGVNIHSSHLDFKYLNKYNEFIYKSKINVSADKDIYYTTNFKINLPKKIIHWVGLDNEFYFEYKNKQIIYIYSDYKPKKKENSWILKDTNNEEVWDSFIRYWAEKKYGENSLRINPNRVTKIYTNGKVKILLLNIKEQEFEKYLRQIKTFKYLN